MNALSGCLLFAVAVVVLRMLFAVGYVVEYVVEYVVAYIVEYADFFPGICCGLCFCIFDLRLPADWLRSGSVLVALWSFAVCCGFSRPANALCCGIFC
jgi:hypothetical protein